MASRLDRRTSPWPGFWLVTGINAAVLGLTLSRIPPLDHGELRGSVLLLFPWVQLVWCVPLIAAAILAGRGESARGMTRAAFMAVLVEYGYWLYLVACFA